MNHVCTLCYVHTHTTTTTLLAEEGTDGAEAADRGQMCCVCPRVAADAVPRCLYFWREEL